jgi:hypothetical protein
VIVAFGAFHRTGPDRSLQKTLSSVLPIRAISLVFLPLVSLSSVRRGFARRQSLIASDTSMVLTTAVISLPASVGVDAPSEWF